MKQQLPLAFTEFVTKYKEEVRGLIESDGVKLLRAEAGGGKSIAIMLIMAEMVKEGQRPIFLVPTINLVKSLQKELRNKAFWLENFGIDPEAFIDIDRGMNFGYRTEHSTKAVISTYDYIGYHNVNTNDYSHYIVDEAHELIGSSNYRDITKVIFKKLENVTYVTATPDGIDERDIAKELYLKKLYPKEKKRNVTIRPLKYTMDNDSVDVNMRVATMQWIIDYELEQNPNRLYVVLHNNIARNIAIIDELRDRGVHALPYNSIKSKGDIDRDTAVSNYIHKLGYAHKELHDLFTNAEVHQGVNVLMATSAAYAGVSLGVKKDVKFIYFSSLPNKAGHPAHLIQLINRVRESSKVNVEMDVWIPELTTVPTSNIISHNELDYLTMKWGFDESMNYKDLYDRLNIDQLNVTISEPEIFIKPHRRKETNAKEVLNIIGSAECNPRMYDFIKTVAACGFSHEMFTGASSIYTKYTTVQSDSCQILAEVADCGVNPSHFVTEKSFSRSNAKKIVYAFTVQTLSTRVVLEQLCKAYLCRQERDFLDFSGGEGLQGAMHDFITSNCSTESDIKLMTWVARKMFRYDKAGLRKESRSKYTYDLNAFAEMTVERVTGYREFLGGEYQDRARRIVGDIHKNNYLKKPQTQVVNDRAIQLKINYNEV